MITINTVEYIIAAVIGVLILLNIILSFNKVENDTVNVILKNWAYSKYFFITFVWGLLGGHFFLGSKKPLFGSSWWLPVVFVIVILTTLFFIGKRKGPSFILKTRYQVILLISGLLFGHFIWSQRHIPEISFPW